jgi:hypothetical protein
MAARNTGHGGARPGAGRPRQEARDEFDRLLKKAIPAATVEGILNTLATEALNGNLKAAQLVLAYLVGTPIQRQEVSGPDGGNQKIVVEYEDVAPVPDSE